MVILKSNFNVNIIYIVSNFILAAIRDLFVNAAYFDHTTSNSCYFLLF